MELINNTTKTLRDDLAVEIKHGSRLSIAAACFSIYAFQKLKKDMTYLFVKSSVALNFTRTGTRSTGF